MVKCYKNCPYFATIVPTPKPHSNSLEPELFHRLQQKSPAPQLWVSVLFFFVAALSHKGWLRLLYNNQYLSVLVITFSKTMEIEFKKMYVKDKFFHFTGSSSATLNIGTSSELFKFL